eukprot:scaffold51854_cov53-Phaeocystis_antarctica.AAC.1
MGRAKVAENISVCRSSARGSPERVTILRICGSKPMSSIRSASSSTRKRQRESETRPRLRKSSSRPGVATRISAPAARASSCGRAVAPPYAHVLQCKAPEGGGGASKVNLAHSSSIWMASSRVGASTRADGIAGVPSERTLASSVLERRRPSPGRACLARVPVPAAPAATLAMRGSRKAVVLPLPVCAHAMTSWPLSARGTVCFWIGVGDRYRMRSGLSRLSAAHAGMELRSSSKLCIEGTAASLSPAPRRFTGMASYV